MPLYDISCIIAIKLSFGFFEHNVPCTENLSNDDDDDDDDDDIIII